MLSAVTRSQFARQVISKTTGTKLFTPTSSVGVLNTKQKVFQFSIRNMTNLPSVEVMQGFPDPKSINITDYCAGKNVIIVGLPGAFTPT